MIHFKALRLAAVVIGGALVAGPIAVAAQDAVLAKVNGQEIKDSDLKLAEAEVGSQLAEFPPDKRKRLLLEFVIEMRLFSDAADAAKLTSGPDFEKRLAYWTTRAKRDAYYDSSVKGSISDSVAKEIYEDKIKTIPAEDEVEARHILVESEEKAKEVLEKVGKGEDFTKLAEAYSSDPSSKAQGGKLGYFSKGQIQMKEFEDAAFALKKGEVSKPVKTQAGWHVIKVDDRRAKPLPTFDEVKDRILESLVQQKGHQVVTDLRAKGNIEYVDAGIVEQVKQEEAINAAKKKVLEQQMDEQLKSGQPEAAPPAPK